MELFLNGVQASLDGLYFENSLADAIYRSLFTWSRAKVNDELINNKKFGWWANCLSLKTDDYGSRLWIFMRSKIEAITPQEIEGVVKEALKWLIDDGIASSVEVTAQRDDLDKISLKIVVQTDVKTELVFKDLKDGIY